jgi:hypothetical protein
MPAPQAVEGQLGELEIGKLREDVGLEGQAGALVALPVPLEPVEVSHDGLADGGVLLGLPSGLPAQCSLDRLAVGEDLRRVRRRGVVGGAENPGSVALLSGVGADIPGPGAVAGSAVAEAPAAGEPGPTDRLRDGQAPAGGAGREVA